MHTAFRQTLLVTLLVASGLMAACGGGGSSHDDTPVDGGAGAGGSSSSTAPEAEVCVPPAAASSSSSVSPVATTPVEPLACPPDAWFCDNFQSGTADKWDLTPGTGGAFAVLDEPGSHGNKVLQYTAGTAGGVIALLKDSEWAGVNRADYYVEARIKPQINGTTGSKHLFLLAHYQDASNALLGGLNVQSTSASTQAEAGIFNNSTSPTRAVQMRRPIIMGTQGQNDGQWYTVRYEVIGSTQTLYLDGERIGSTSYTAPAAGKIGLYTANKSFLIDDIRVGDPTVKPVELTLSPSSLTYVAEAGDAAYVVSVTAKQNDGTTADTFTVTSSNPAVASATLIGQSVTITPLAEGTTEITFKSGSDASVTRVIKATIGESFQQSATTYDLSSVATPKAGEAAAYADGVLSLAFDAAPTLGSNGSIRIFKSADDTLVDTIKINGDVDAIGAAAGGNARGVSRVGAWVEGRKLVIAPHDGKLAYGTGYYVAIARDAVSGKLAGKTFDGLGKAAGWQFTTRAAPAGNLSTLTVDDDGTTADFRSVQGALNYVMKNVATDAGATINVKNGTYNELLFLRGKNNITIRGESRTGTVIQYRNAEALNSGGGGSATGTPTSGGGRAVFLIESVDMLTLDTLTLKNTWLRSAASSQAETIYFNSEGRLVAKNADFHSEQDTLQIKGYSWFYNTLVSGNVDFIWGNNRVALFENSEIRSVGDTMCSSVGYVLQARTVSASDKGFVFLNSKLTSGRGPGGAPAPTKTYLARSGGSSTYFDNIAFINTTMGAHIAEVGWAYGLENQPKSNPEVSTAASGWREFNSVSPAGAVLDLGKRLGGYALTSAESAEFTTRAKVFSAYGSGAGWNPQP
ncbi:MAG: pectinesterase family protein [Candidatus Dactylopiibacterium sp.]|nr:pectinesterase family protein [Candidatus Dactylopiibacterium sp.]